MHPPCLQVELREILVVERGRGGKRLQDADRAVEFAVERGRIDARGFEQPPFRERTIVRKRAQDQNASQQHTRQHGAEHENQQINANRAQDG